MGRPKKNIDTEVTEIAEKNSITNVVMPSPLDELTHLQELYAELKGRGINSIGDLEVKISRLQR